MTTPHSDLETAESPTLQSANGASRKGHEGKLETIRELLVGDDLDSLKGRLDHLEQGQGGRYEKLRDELTAKFEALHEESELEIKQVGEMVVEMVGRLQSEDKARAEEMEGIGNKLSALETRIGEMRDSHAEEVRRLQEESSSKVAELASLVEKQQEDLARHSVTRTDFAKILNGLAGSIAHEKEESGAGESDAGESNSG